MNVIGAPCLLWGQETRSDWKLKGSGDETVVTTSSATTVKRSNISTGKMAKDNLYPFQSMEDYVAKNDDIFLQHLQHNPAHLLTTVRLFISGAQDPSDEDITEQFLAARPQPERAPPPQEGAPPLQEIAAPQEEGPLPEIHAAESPEAPQLAA